jgi:D-glycero-D-manno-heptose 1,7-bisphosphate phosphatase
MPIRFDRRVTAEPAILAAPTSPDGARALREFTVFVDRDGVLVRDRPDYVKDWSEVEIVPGSFEALGRLRSAGARVFVATNQSIVGRGIVRRQVVDELHARLADIAERHGARIESFLVCPHRPEDACACRKPKPGLLLQAGRASGVDLSRSFMVGDQVSDALAGVAAGCTAILLADRPADRATPWRVVPGLADAVDLILEARRSDP